MGGARLRAAIALLTVTAMAGLASPAAAGEDAHVCTVLVGTKVTGPSGEFVVASASSPAGGVGECELHTLDERSTLTGIDTPNECAVYADVDEDAFVEHRAQTDDVYEPGTALVAFCEVGVTMAENEVVLGPA